MRRTLLTFIALLAIAMVCRGQSIKVFTVDQGLSSSLINDIYQDRDGIVWIATEDGLNRYDGVKMTTYRNNPNDPHSLAHNYVRTLFEDKDGHILVGTYGGVQLYDPATDRFSSLAQFRDGSTLSNYITKILQRRNGEIWVSGNRLARLEIEGDSLFYGRLDLPIPTSIVSTMLEDRWGNFWLSKEKDGLYRMAPNGDVKEYPANDGTPFFSVLCEDGQGNVYGGGSGQGVYRYDRKQDKFLPIVTDGRQKMAVMAMFPANQNELYIGTDGEGMKIYNNKTRQLTDYFVEENTIDIRHAKVHAIWRDHTDNLWLAIYQKGVMVIPPQRNAFGYWGYKSVSRNIIGDDCVMSLYKDSGGTIYVGTDTDGLYLLDSDGNQKAHYSHTADSRSVPSVVMAIYEDSKHHLWLGSYGGGAAWCDPHTGQCTYIRLVDEKGNVASNVYAFVEDRQQRVWIATMGTGLFSYDLTTGRVVHYPQFDSWVDCLYYSRAKNSLFLGTYYGVCVADLNQEVLEDHHILYKSIIYSFYEQEDGHVWVGSSTGLLDWDTATDSIRRYTTDDGLCNNFVCAIQGGDDGHLWMSTSNGLSRFHPSTRQFTNYYVDDGLQGNEFSKNASWRDAKSGLLYFGGVNGITYFKPQEITATNRKWHVRVTDFYVFGRPVRKGMTSGGGIIDCPVYKAETFRLSHSDNAFTVEFSTVELDNTDRVVYMYSLNDDPWIALPQGTNQVSFSNLASGTYDFRLKAKDGEVESEVKSIEIRIAPPWWNSWWAWLAYVVVLICVASVVTYQVRLRYQSQQERLRLLRAEELNEEKLQFFINVSHDIRTPMTLILSPLRKLMTMDKEEECQKMYRTIHRNAERILGLVNQLMDIRKIDKGQMHLTFHEVDIVPLLDEICGTFADLANMKNISFAFRHEGITEFPLWLDVANFDKIVLNILSNAFKFTPDGGEIELALEERTDAGVEGPLAHCAELRITDSGVGIDKEELERIFDRFYQTKNILNYKGTGVGLHLTRSLVKLHYGEVYAENREDGRTGSRFVVRLPMGCAHLREDEKTLQHEMPSATPLPLDREEVREYNLSTLMTEVEQPTSSRSRHSMLIVEDDEEIRRYLRQELSDKYRVAEATNGREALDYIFQNEPDIVISDIMMAEMDGLTLCRKIKQNIQLNHIPVVLLTARAREEDNIEGLNVGADAYLTKPFSVKVLRHTVKNLLQSREQLRTIYSGGQQTGEERLEKLDVKSPDDRLMERIMKVVNQNMSNKNLSVELLATEVGLSRSQLHRKLKELTNQSTRDFLRNVRMKQAAQLLGEKNHAISEVAQMVGYDNLSTFSVCFKELYGVSPSAYRRQHSASGEVNS